LDLVAPRFVAFPVLTAEVAATLMRLAWIEMIRIHAMAVVQAIKLYAAVNAAPKVRVVVVIRAARQTTTV
jgi:hypothetical protein